ncbi:sensor histidine kinase [Aestuariispira insulae]|uniref:histidine kinase n=1 Tax=Aestuariispira insulae TaxID=1461337 RepID=A0A3D9HXX2_9PROT|nr:ATP-binding protein [Aestuariispira insulae]RED54352.1 signal transduction histidine kinase [Aestuariispira insulae]
MGLRFRDRISFKLARTGVVLAFLVGLLLSSFQLYWDYREEDTALQAIIDRILSVAQPPASRAVHILDEDLAAEVVDGLLKYRFVRKAEIFDDLGIELASKEKPEENSSTRWITRNITREFEEHTISLLSEDLLDVAPGRLSVTIDRDRALADFFGRSLLVLGSGIVRNMLLVLLLFVAFYWLLTKPLNQLAHSIGVIDAKNPSGGLVEVAPRHQQDELGQVADMTNRLMKSVRDLLKERAEAEKALIAARDQLEMRVLERTKELQYEIFERRNAQEALKQANQHLEERVEERTSSLMAEISERKKAERELIAAKENAELANRTKSEFLANMSHELRTPLNAVIGFSTIMNEEMFGEIGNPKYKEYCHDIYRSSTHLLQLIGDILDISKVEVGELTLKEEVSDVDTIADTCLKTLETSIDNKKLKIVRAFDDFLPQLFADPLRVRQVLLNLLSNAVKFTEVGGAITLTITSGPKQEVIIAVRDTGIGIPADKLTRVLEPFGQVDNVLSRTHEGIGLGLSLTKALMELHGGNLVLESEEGVGTCVTVTFPESRSRVKAMKAEA